MNEGVIGGESKYIGYKYIGYEYIGYECIGCMASKRRPLLHDTETHKEHELSTHHPRHLLPCNVLYLFILSKHRSALMYLAIGIDMEAIAANR